MSHKQLNVLLEDNHLLAVSKPADLPTMGVAQGRESLLMMAKQYVKQKYGKPGNVYLGVVSRLDALVTGIVVFARTSKAAARLAEQFRKGSVDKRYWAIVSPIPKEAEATLHHWLVKDERQRKMQVVNSVADGAKEARLGYRVLDELDRCALLEVQLLTGRKHQIRVQLAYLGYPVLGDKRYGSRRSFSPGIALHCRQLAIMHPVRKEPITLTDPLPPFWRQLGVKRR